jgi:hypothetical protein
MALLRVDSFDHYDTATAEYKGWTFATPAASPGGVGGSIGSFGRNGTQGMRLVSPNSGGSGISVLAVTGASGTTAVVGFAFNTGSVVRAGEMRVLSIIKTSVENVTLTIGAGGALSLRRGTVIGTILATGATSLSSSTWYYLELKVLFSDTVGTYELRVNGVSEFSGTNADTVSSGSAGWDSLGFGHITLTNTPDPELSYDDLYVCDGTGGVNDTFLGDHRIVAVVASSGNGTAVDWSPSTGSDHGALVDENPPNETDYNQSGTAGHRDTYNFAAVGVAGTVKAVQTVNLIKADAAGIRYVGDVARIGGTNYDSTGVVVGSDWTYRLEMHPTSPATSAAWTIAEIDVAEFGVKVTA